MTETPNLPAERKPQLHTGAAVAALVPQTLDEAYRLADAMSRSGLTPNGIKTPEAVMVAIMAGAELGLPPFQACQSFAIINGRPSLWGDSIPALLWSNGFKIREWTDNSAPDYPDDMTARCEITRPDGEVIQGEFSVRDAKDAKLWTKDGPWQTAKKRMLKMRARSFAARDGAADLLRGLYIAEEAQDFTPIGNELQTTGTGMIDRLKANAVEVDAPGFNVRGITDATNEAKPKKARAKASAPAAESVETVETTAQPSEGAPAQPDGPVDAEFIDAVLGGDDLPGDLARPTSTASVQNAETGPDSSASATDASGGSAAATSSPTPQDEPLPDGEPDEVQEGCAGPDEFYYHTDLPQVGDDGKRPTFMNGVLVGRRTVHDDVLTYAEHAPLVSTLAAEPEAEDEAPLDGALATFWGRMLACDSWLQIKAPSLLGELLKSPDFEELDPEEQDAIRVKIVDFVDTLKPRVDQAQDPTFFRLWLAKYRNGTADDADAIDGTFQLLQKEPAFQRLADPVRAKFAEIVVGYTSRLRAAR